MADLREYLLENLRLARAVGKNRVLAACPVHKGGMERNPSFIVNAHTGRYFCYSCQIKGGLDELKRLLGASAEYLRLIEAEAEVKEETNEDINEAVLAIFHKRPTLLSEVGFTDDVLKMHNIGFDDREDRVTFPIRNRYGKLVAISGRDVSGVPNVPRYKVYTAQMLRGAVDEHYKPQPKKYLWGAHTITNPATTVYVVEGYKACLWMRQAGVLNCVATMGTMVKQEQLSELRYICDRVILLFDMDEAGIKASKNLMSELLKKGMPTTRLEYQAPAPDDLSIDEIRKLTHMN